MTTVLWVVLAYGITFLENVLQMKCYAALIAGKRTKTASLDALYDLILLLDVWLMIEKWWLVFPIVIASWHGSYYAFPMRKEQAETEPS